MLQIKEVDALRTHISQLKYAVATTMCRKTVGVLRQMLREAEAKLCATEPRSRERYPSGNQTDRSASSGL